MSFRDTIMRNRKFILLTIEIFWIVIFLLHRMAGEALEMPEFIYVNF